MTFGIRACASLAIGFSLAGTAAATENFALRYAPGSGGGDLSAPLEPGLYFQLPGLAYRGTLSPDPARVTQGAAELFTGALAPLAAAFPSAQASTSVRGKVVSEAQVMLPRWIYMSSERWLGGTLGASVMLPVMQRRVEVTNRVGATTVGNVDPATLSALTQGALSVEALAAATNAAVRQAADAQAAAASDQRFGVADLELAPLLRWSHGAQQWLFAPTLVLPTGEYDQAQAASAGAGNYCTFRPTLQFGYIADGWDVGARTAFSLNSKNRDTGYRSGNVFNLDASVMRSLDESWRAGVIGYAVMQTTRDRLAATPDAGQALTAGRRGRVFGLGPGVNWLDEGGSAMVDARVMKEFGAADRPAGAALWVSLSLPVN